MTNVTGPCDAPHCATTLDPMVHTAFRQLAVCPRTGEEYRQKKAAIRGTESV